MQWLQFSGYQIIVHSPVSLGSLGECNYQVLHLVYELKLPKLSQHSNLKAKVLGSGPSLQQQLSFALYVSSSHSFLFLYYFISNITSLKPM